MKTKKIISKNLKIIWFSLFLSILTTIGYAQNQVVVNAVVTPPYSTQLSYYVDNPDRLIVNFVNTTSRNLEVYIQGRITGDNGVEIKTDPTFIMPTPVVISALASYQLTPSNIEDVFSGNHLLYTGITENQLIQMGGLPEGNYQFCFDVYDYNTGQLLSNPQANCSNFFTINYNDPPVILNPVCGSEVVKSIPQNLMISWTTPVGAPPTVRYRLVMVEMQPGDRDPTDAMMVASPGNYFIEENDLTIPQFIIDASQPPLTAGSSYAFYVKAYDPDNQVVFKNNGTSEICWFTYKNPVEAHVQTPQYTVSQDNLQDFLEDIRVLPSTKIQGRLFCQLASEARMTGIRGGAQSMESQGKNNPYNQPDDNRQDTYDYNETNQTSSADNNNNAYAWSTGNNYQYTTTANYGVAQNMQFNPPFGTGTMNAELYDLNGTKPLANMRIRLVPRVSLRQADGLFDTETLYGSFSYAHKIDWNRYVFFDLNGQIVSTEKVRAMLDKPLAVTVTDDKGNYTFDFRTDFFTGPLVIMDASQATDGQYLNVPGVSEITANYQSYAGIISLKLEVLNEKFASPDVEIFAFPGDQLTIPDQVALIKDYDVDAHVYVEYDVGYHNHVSPHDTLPKVLNGGEPLPNALVRIVRDYQKIKNEHPTILLNEGNGQGKILENQFGKFKVVFEGKTDERGDLKIKHLVKRWEPGGDNFGGPYYIMIQTRSDSIENGAENTLYNFKPYFGPFSLTSKIDTQWNNTRHYTDATVYKTGPVEYNHYYSQPPQMTASHGLKAAKPEIKGHVMAATNLENIGLKDIPVILFYKEDNQPDYLAHVIQLAEKGDYSLAKNKKYRVEPFYFTMTNEGGFFRFRNLKVKHDGLTPTGPYRRIQIGSDNYGNSRIYKYIIHPPLDVAPYNLQYGELKYIKFQLEPRQWLKGEVVDEDGKPVPAYLRVLPNTPYVKTEEKDIFGGWGSDTSQFNPQIFKLPAADTDNDIEVLPLSNQYFQDTIHLAVMPDNNYLKIVVKKKKHRLYLHFKDREFGKDIAGAEVMVGDSLFYGKSDEQGKILVEFSSPGEQFTFKFKADGYTPVQKVFRIPVSAHATRTEEISLSIGLSLSGKVTEKDSGQPIEGALLFVELQNTGGEALYIETRSDAQGNYLLRGIPLNLTQVDVHVAKEGKNPSYIGGVYQVSYDFRQTTRHQDFTLKAVNMDMSNIWGFPVVVEGIKQKSGYGTSISGYFYNLPHEPGIQCKNQDEKVYFNSIKIRPGASKIEPLNDQISLKRYQIPVKLDGGITGKFAAANAAQSPLVLKKKNEKGAISSSLKIDLSSFNFAYDFHGNFYVGKDTLHSGFDLFNSKLTFTSGSPKYYVFDIAQGKPVPVSGYKIFGFNATSTFAGSYYQDGKIHIGTILHTDIPLPGQGGNLDLKIQAGDVVVSKDDIDLIPKEGGLVFDLEKWKVRSSGGWNFDKNKDAIVLNRAKIQTGLGVEVSLKNLNIRPNALREGEIDLGEGLTLGGVARLKTAKGLQPVFNYDAGVGHYRISLVGSANGPAAWVDNLPALDGRLEFRSVDLLSNNTTEMSLGKTMRFHRLIDVYVDQIMSGDGFFSLAGIPDMKIPGWISGQAVMTYYKEGNRIKFKVEPFGAKVDCNANTVYHLSKDKGAQELKDRLFTAYGTFEIKPPAGSQGEALKVKGYLVKKPNQGYIDAIEQDVQMGKETMHITGGKIQLTPSGNAWDELHYTAYTRSKGLDDANAVEYVVHGGIEANSDQIKVDQIETPFGELSMAYLFDESALVGNLVVKYPINLGYAGINNGMMETRFDPDGFYFGVVANIVINGFDFDGGLILGSYGKSMEEANAKIFARMKKTPPEMPELHGFYFIGEKLLFDKTIDLGVVDADAKARMGGYVGADFAQGKVVGGGYGYAYIHGGQDVELCYFGVTAYAYENIEVKYQNKVLSFCDCGYIKVIASACGLSVDKSIRKKIYFDSNKNWDFDISLSGSCPSQLCDDYDK